MATLADYLTSTRALLRDSGTGSSPAFSTGDLTEFINRGMQERDLRARLYRVRISRPFIASQFTYTFADIVSSGAVLTPSGLANASVKVIDLMSVVFGTQTGVSINTGLKVPLGRKAHSWLEWLLSTSYPTYPRCYSVLGVGSQATAFVGPPPAAAYPCVWDFFCYSPSLSATTDADPLPYPLTDPVPFYAAHFAKIQVQRYDEAEEMLKIAERRMKMAIIGARPLAVSDPWSDLRGAR